MEASAQELLRTYAPELGQGLDYFLEHALLHGVIEPTNATRLLDRLPQVPEQFPLHVVRNRLERLAALSPVDDEVLACALRTGDDFAQGTPTLLKAERGRGHLIEGRVEGVDGDVVVVRSSPYLAHHVVVYYPGLLFERDHNKLQERSGGSGHQSLASFVIRLSFFDPRLRGCDSVIDRVLRSNRHSR